MSVVFKWASRQCKHQTNKYELFLQEITGCDGSLNILDCGNIKSWHLMRSLIIANSTVCSTACKWERQMKTYLSLLIILKNNLTAAFPTVVELPPISGNGKYIFWRFSQIYNVPISFNLRHMGELLVYFFLFNTLRPRQNGRRFADDIFKCILLNENLWIPLMISLKFVPQVRINNFSALVQIMAWRRPGDKPLSESMLVSLPTHICVTRPQWVNVVSIVLAFSDIIVKPNWMRWTTLFEEIIFYIWLKMFECNEYIYLKPQRISKFRRCSISQHLGGDVDVVLTWYWGVFGHCSENIM